MSDTDITCTASLFAVSSLVKVILLAMRDAHGTEYVSRVIQIACESVDDASINRASDPRESQIAGEAATLLQHWRKSLLES